MKLGVVFPQTEITSDPSAVKEYAQAAESLGYNHLLAFDHVLGANAESRRAGAAHTATPTSSTSRSCCSAISPG